MIRIKSFSLLLFLIFIISRQAYSTQQTEVGDNKFIVTTDWLAAHLNDPDIVIIEIGKQEDYNERHIPGSVFMKTSDISTPHDSGLTLQIPSIEKLINSFEKAGVSNNSRIILYSGYGWVTPVTRFYLTLDYMGLADNTSILDGGILKWEEEKRPLTSEVKKIKRGNITVKSPNKYVVVEVDVVTEALNDPNYQIVDARTENYYSGTAESYKRNGHITGATNIPYTSLTTEDEPNSFKSEEELRKMFADANVDESKKIISYCHVGQEATLIYFIAKYLGYNNVQLYDGSYQEWDERTDLPVTGPVKRKN